MKKKKKMKTGGIALLNGISFTSEYRQVTVQDNNGRITGKSVDMLKDKSILNKIPIIRGIYSITGQISNSSEKFVKSIDENDEVTGKHMLFIYSLMLVGCILFPTLISLLFKPEYRSYVQMIGIIMEFLAYILILSSSKKIATIYMYHGAEHKAVNTYEKYNNIEDLTLDNIKKSSKIHKRCGGNIIVYLILLVVLSALIPINNMFLKFIVMCFLTILNIGIAIEIINIFSKLPKPLDILNYPACIIQLITTKEPTDRMLEVARIGIIACVREKEKTILEFVNECKSEKNIENTEDIYSILEAVTYKDRKKLRIHKNNYIINISQELNAKHMLHRYLDENYPLQYLTHKQYFYNEDYYVDENVLIPRSDTEILVEKSIEYINKEENINKVIDLCTGSGAIGISIAKNVSRDINVELIDISQGALNVANKNIYRNNVKDRVKSFKSDLLLQKIELIEQNKEEKVDMIVSNPPYIKTKELENLDEYVKKEPFIALNGGEDGMDFYNKIINQAKSVLKPNGLLLFEIGFDELEQIKKIIIENNEYTLLESIKDYGGNDRVVICRFQQKLEEKS